MKALILYPQHNTPGDKDATGAFQPEGRKYAARLRELHPGAVTVERAFDNHLGLAQRRKQVEGFIEHGPGNGGVGHWDVVAFFCHGLRNSIQTGHTKQTVERLADSLSYRAQGVLRVPLYACSAASGLDVPGGPGGDGGFADTLRDALNRRGYRGSVDAHKTGGHTTWNPFVRRFWLDGSGQNLLGGDWLVAPGSPLWKSWVRKLGKGSKDTLRYDFPLLDIAEIAARVERP